MPRHFTNWLKAYLKYTSSSEAPDLFHFWTGVSVVAGALRRRVWIDQAYFQWTPNFYIILIAPPGIVSKSTTAGIGMALLREVDGIHFGPDSITWQALTQAMAEAQELIPLSADPMGEALPMSCLTIVSSELGSFLNPQDREMVDVLVDLWDSRLGAWVRKTKMSGTDHIENPWINLIACTTPAWIRDNMPAYVIGGGFASRCVFVYAEKKRHFAAYPKFLVGKTFDQQRRYLIEDLALIGEIRGEYILHPDAVEWGVKWYEEHWGPNRPPHLANERFGGYIARKQTHMHKLAMVIAASQRSDTIILRDDLITAERFVTGLEPEMLKVFENIGMNERTVNVRDIIATCRVYGQIERQKLYRLVWQRMAKEEFDNAVTSAIHTGYIREKQIGMMIMLIANQSKAEPKKEDEDSDEQTATGS